MRFFLVDRVTELVIGERALGVKCVTLSDEVLHDHFPDFPVMPGALIVESVAQLAGFLLEMTFNDEGDPDPQRALLTMIKEAKFYETAGPGDRLDLSVTIGPTLEGAAQVKGEVKVGDKRIARVGLTFMLKRVGSARVHEQRRYIYKLWTKDLPLPRPLP
jgi:3-hydroxyacyl-[acyl-carrier-protein] dehydratase